MNKNSKFSPRFMKSPRKKVVFAPLLHHSQKKTQLNRSNLHSDVVGKSIVIANQGEISTFLEEMTIPKGLVEPTKTIECAQGLENKDETDDSLPIKSKEEFECTFFSLDQSKNSIDLPSASIQHTMYCALLPEKQFDSVSKNQKSTHESTLMSKRNYVFLVCAKGLVREKSSKSLKPVNFNQHGYENQNTSQDIDEAFMHDNPVLHCLTVDQDKNLYFMNVPSRTECTQLHPSPFVIDYKKSMGYMYGAYSNVHEHEDQTPMHTFSFKFLNWTLNPQQKRVNSVLSLQNKVIDRRYGHTMVNYQGNLYIFGGYMSKQVYINEDLLPQLGSITNSIVRFDKRRQVWNNVFVYQSEGLSSAYITQRPVQKNIPTPRMFHTATLFQDKMIIFGGLLENEKCSNELFSFDLTSKTWKVLPSKTSVIPCPRKLHSASRYKNILLVYGGLDESNLALSDLYAYNIITQVWNKINLVSYSTSNVPEGRYSHVSAILPEHSRVVSARLQDKQELQAIFETSDTPALIIFAGYIKNDSKSRFDGYMINLPKSIVGNKTQLPISSTHSDIVIIVDGTLFYVSSCIIYQSEVIYRLCTEPTHSPGVLYSNGRKVLDFSLIGELSCIELRGMHNLISLIYGGFISEVSLEEIKDTLQVASILDIPSIVDYLSRIINTWDGNQMTEEVYISETNILQDYLEYIYRNNIGFDFYLISAQGTAVPTHQYLLAMKFEYFSQILAHRKNSIQKISLPYSESILNYIQAFIYLTEEKFMNLLSVLHSEKLLELQRVAEELKAKELNRVIHRAM